MSRRDDIKPEADAIPFDPTGTELVSESTGEAIRELAAAVGASASPGFNFGKSANLSATTWLQVTGSVPSNRSGITVALNNPEVTQIYVANQDVNTFTISVYEHEGDEINLTLLGSVNVVATRSETFNVSYTVTSGRQLAVALTSGSAKNVNVGLQLKGNI